MPRITSLGKGTPSRSPVGVKRIYLHSQSPPDGKITVPTIGDVAAANMPAKNLQVILTEKLKSVVRKPVVTVAVTEITNNKVYVFGGGVKGGVFTLSQRMTLLQLLCQIEDIGKADLQNAYLMRGKQKLREDFSKLYLKGDANEDVVVEPNDLFIFPCVPTIIST